MTLAWSQDPSPPVGVQQNYGRTFELDLELCRAALVARGFELGAGRGRPIVSLVAAEAGVDEKTLRRFFRGEPLRAETWTSIVRALGLPLQTVLQSAGKEDARGVAPDKHLRGRESSSADDKGTTNEE